VVPLYMAPCFDVVCTACGGGGSNHWYS